MRILERASDLRDARSVRGWLSRVLASTTNDYLRRRRTWHQYETALEAEQLDDVAMEAGMDFDDAVCGCLHKPLGTLKPAQAELLSRIDLAGESREQVAASLGISVGTLTVRLHRARHALRRRLEQVWLTCPVHGFMDCHCEQAEHSRKLRAHGAILGQHLMHRVSA